MNPPNILIVDDEPWPACACAASSRPSTTSAANCAWRSWPRSRTGTQAGAWLREHACDLVLLDVQMPGPDGLQFADSLRERAQHAAHHLHGHLACAAGTSRALDS